MTTAREKAEAFAASYLYGTDDSDAITHAARQLLAIVDQRFAELREKENQCSNTSSAVSSPPVSFSSATTSTEAERTAVATKPVAQTESGTPSPKSGAKSLDERAEALFAANPEWRPRYGYQTLHLISGMDAWRWVDVPIGMSRGFVLQPDRNAHLLSALLPRAIEKWWSGSRHIESSSSVFGWKLTRAFSSGPPRDLESAINILEWA
jgi:hypothetical protein